MKPLLLKIKRENPQKIITEKEKEMIFQKVTFNLGGRTFSQLLSQTLGLEEKRARFLKERRSPKDFKDIEAKILNSPQDVPSLLICYYYA